MRQAILDRATNENNEATRTMWQYMWQKAACVSFPIIRLAPRLMVKTVDYRLARRGDTWIICGEAENGQYWLLTARGADESMSDDVSIFADKETALATLMPTDRAALLAGLPGWPEV